MGSRNRLIIPKWVKLSFTGIWILIFLLYVIFIGVNSNWQFSKYSQLAKIDGFSVCNISDTQSGANAKVTVCGNLVTDGVALLGMYVSRLPEKTLVARNDAGDKFTNGYFSRILILPVDSLPSKYEVVVYFKREIIATKEFDLK